MEIAGKREAILDDILSYLSLAERGKIMRDVTRDHDLPITYFDKAEIFTDDWIDETPHDERGFFVDVQVNDLSQPLDTVSLSFASKDLGAFVDTKERDKSRYALIRVRHVTPKEVRGYLRKIYPLMVEKTSCLINRETGEFETAKTICTPVNGRWRRIAPTYAPLEENRINPVSCLAPFDDNNVYDLETHNGIQMSVSMAFTNRYYWKVSLGYDGFPSASFITDPIGAQEIFRLRDIPEGRERRAALRNWVSEHWRKSRKDDSIKFKVREHLRGSTIFYWNGLKCIIQPSDFDLEKNDLLAGVPVVKSAVRYSMPKLSLIHPPKEAA